MGFDGARMEWKWSLFDGARQRMGPACGGGSGYLAPLVLMVMERDKYGSGVEATQ